MPITIDFYILTTPPGKDTDLFICRLVEKIYSKGYSIQLQTLDQSYARKLDQLLWTFRDTSFLPHKIDDATAPIQIATQQQASNEPEILINLTDAILPFYTSYKRVLEIIPNEPQLIVNGRKKYQDYQKQHQQVTVHKI